MCDEQVHGTIVFDLNTGGITTTDRNIELGRYSLDDLNEQVAWNDGWPVGHPAGMPVIDFDAPHIYWGAAGTTSFGLGDKYIKAYFDTPKYENFTSRSVGDLENPFKFYVKWDGDVVASGDYHLYHLNDLITSIAEVSEWERNRSQHEQNAADGMADDLDYYSRVIANGHYLTDTLNDYIFVRKQYNHLRAKLNS